jgi:hypothetical protein
MDMDDGRGKVREEGLKIARTTAPTIQSQQQQAVQQESYKTKNTVLRTSNEVNQAVKETN